MNKFALSVTVYTRYTDNFALMYLQRKVIDSRYFFRTDNFEMLYIEYDLTGLCRIFLYLKLNRPSNHLCRHLVFGSCCNIYDIDQLSSPYNGTTVGNVLNFL